jgi:hypothetical protein
VKSIPQECAEWRADFVERALWPAHLRFMQGMADSNRAMGDSLFPYDWDGEKIAHDLRHIAAMAELWTATPDMMNLMLHAALSLPPQVLKREALPSQQGFLYLPEPLVLKDIRDEPLPVHAIMWSEREIGRPGEVPGAGLSDVTRGVVLYLFCKTAAPGDPLLMRATPAEVSIMLRDAPRMSLVHAQSVGFDRVSWSLDTSQIKGTPEFRAMVGRQLMRSSHDGEVIDANEDGSWQLRTLDGHVVTAHPDAIIQFLHTFFHFVRSELSGLDREFPARAMGKWLRRIGIPDSPVTVVRLRRRASGQETGNGWALTYRYVRRGHWRRVWYGPMNGPRYQQHVWIAPTIVGPEGAPIRVRDVVNLVQQ